MAACYWGEAVTDENANHCIWEVLEIKPMENLEVSIACLDGSCLNFGFQSGKELIENFFPMIGLHPREIFVLKGKATMWIEDRGSFPLEPGVFVVVPKGLKHRTYDVVEELHIYDVFSPPMF